MVLGEDIIQRALKEGRNFLLEPEAKKLCELYGIPVAKSIVAKNLDEALKIANKIGYPVVLKIVSPDILHKTDIGGVKINIKNDDELIKAYNEIMANVKKHAPKAHIVGMLIQEFVPPSVEVIIGVAKDPQFGHAIMFGLGGIFVEVLKDVTFRVLPITRLDAEEMLSEIKGRPILEGARGGKPLDKEAIINMMLSVSRMIENLPIIEQLDLNPILVFEKGAKVIDARVIIGRRT